MLCILKCWSGCYYTPTHFTTIIWVLLKMNKISMKGCGRSTAASYVFCNTVSLRRFAVRNTNECKDLQLQIKMSGMTVVVLGRSPPQWPLQRPPREQQTGFRPIPDKVSVSVWQHVQLWKQIRPWDTLACCCGVSQPTTTMAARYTSMLLWRFTTNNNHGC